MRRGTLLCLAVFVAAARPGACAEADACVRTGTRTAYVSNWTQQGDVFQPEVETFDQQVLWEARIIKLDIWEYRVTAIRALERLVPEAADNTVEDWLRWRKRLRRGEAPDM